MWRVGDDVRAEDVGGRVNMVGVNEWVVFTQEITVVKNVVTDEKDRAPCTRYRDVVLYVKASG